MSRPIPYRGAYYMSQDGMFMEWWRNTMPQATFAVALAEWDKTQDQTKWPYVPG